MVSRRRREQCLQNVSTSDYTLRKRLNGVEQSVTMDVETGGHRPPLAAHSAERARIPSELELYMSECRGLVLAELERQLPRSARYRSALYDLVLEYPLREA